MDQAEPDPIQAKPETSIKARSSVNFALIEDVFTVLYNINVIDLLDFLDYYVYYFSLRYKIEKKPYRT